MRRLLFCLLVTTPAHAATPFPGGVLDSGTAYLGSEAGIDAVDVATGKLLWPSPRAGSTPPGRSRRTCSPSSRST